jgi:surface antigen
MADDVDKRLAEIEAKNKEKQRIAKERAAKLKAAQAKADADRKKREQERAKVAEENSQRRGVPVTEKRLNPQTEAGKNAKTDQRIERENKTNLSNKYGQAYRKREDLIERYAKTGDPKDKQAALSAQAALEPIVAEYIKLFGTEPPGYKPASNLSKPTVRTEGQQRQTAKPTSGSTQSIEDKRGSNLNAAPKIIAQSLDPNIQRIIDAAAKAGIQLSVADATTMLPDTGVNDSVAGSVSMASTRKQTTQYTMQQVRSAADGIYQNSIGRALNDDELRMLYQSLNNTLKATPTVTKTSATGNTVTTGGVDESGFIRQQAEANPEFANYQKATTYFDAMLNTLQGSVGGGI